MAANRILDVSKFLIHSSPGTKSGSVDGPGSVRTLSSCSLDHCQYMYNITMRISDHRALETRSSLDITAKK